MTSATPSQAAQSDHATELRTLKLSVVLYVFVFALKMGAYFWTGVMALLAEGLHTLSDIFVSGFLLLAAWWSQKKPDEVHQFGYGRAQYVGALVAATLFISFTSFELYKEAIPRLFSHEEVKHQNVSVAIGVLVLSMLLAMAPLVSLLRQKKRGAAAKAQLFELVNDQLGLVAALIGTGIVMAGYPIGDPIAAMAVATIIGVNGVGLFRENLSYLVGRSPGDDYMKSAEEAIRSVAQVRAFHTLRAQMIGPDAVHLSVHLELDPSLSLRDANGVAHVVEGKLHGLTPNQDFISVHVDPVGVRQA